MINENVTDAEFVKITRNLFGWKTDPSKTEDKNQQRREADLFGLWSDAQTHTGIRFTAWAATQAVAEYVDHVQPVRTKGDQAAARAERLLTTEAPGRIKVAAWEQFATV